MSRNCLTAYEYDLYSHFAVHFDQYKPYVYYLLFIIHILLAMSEIVSSKNK